MYPWKHYKLKTTSEGSFTQHQSAVHEGVKYPCSQCNFQANSRGHLTQHKESNTFKGNPVKKNLRREVCINKREQYMKMSNTLVGNAVNNFLRKEIWINIRGQLVKYYYLFIVSIVSD